MARPMFLTIIPVLLCLSQELLADKDDDGRRHGGGRENEHGRGGDHDDRRAGEERQEFGGRGGILGGNGLSNAANNRHESWGNGRGEPRLHHG